MTVRGDFDGTSWRDEAIDIGTSAVDELDEGSMLMLRFKSLLSPSVECIIAFLDNILLTFW